MSHQGGEPPGQAGDPRGEKRREPPSLMERMRSLFGMQVGSVREDLEDAIEGDSTSNAFSLQERSILRNVLDLHEIRVGDIMVPRSDILAVALHDSLAAVLARFREAGHSRLPVHADTLDEPRGMVHIRDFVHHMTEPAPADTGGPSGTFLHFDATQSLEASGITRTVLFVPPSMLALDLLVRMQATRTHMALVIDEFGGTDGLVTIEDIMEVIVGDIEDEHDEDETPKIQRNSDGTFLADARVSLDELRDAFGADVSTEEDAEDVETLGGLITWLAGHVPARGERIQGGAGLEFEVVDADPRRVKSVILRPVRLTQPGEPGAGPQIAPAHDADTAGA